MSACVCLHGPIGEPLGCIDVLVQCTARVVGVRVCAFWHRCIKYMLLFFGFFGGAPRQNDILVDSADPEYEQFLVDQLTRHVDRLPHFAGIAIDRPLK